MYIILVMEFRTSTTNATEPGSVTSGEGTLPQIQCPQVVLWPLGFALSKALLSSSATLVHGELAYLLPIRILGLLS